MSGSAAVDLHRHLDPVELPDGSTVWAASLPIDGWDRDGAPHPTAAVYFDRRWSPPWPHRHLDWPDFGLPRDAAAFSAVLDQVLASARAGDRVEIGCIGGHGRTGTALACLAVLAGLEGDSVRWIRAVYCDQAVETIDQAAFARAFRPAA